MIGAVFKALGQLGDPRLRAVAGKSLIGAIAVYVVLAVALGWVFSSTTLLSVGWIDTLVDWLGGLAAFGVSLILFPAIVSLIVSVFLDQVATAVEARHYPDLPPPGPTTTGAIGALWETVWPAVRFAGVSIALNILLMPAYLIPGINFVVFFALNGYLLGREYYEMVAARRLDDPTAATMRSANGVRLWVAGAVIALLLTIPLVNIFMPIVATAFMVHVFEGIRRRQGVSA